MRPFPFSAVWPASCCGTPSQSARQIARQTAAPSPAAPASPWRARVGALLLCALAPVAQAGTELAFQWTPRAFANDGVGEWRLAYDRMVDEQFAVGLAFGLADIAHPPGGAGGSGRGLSAALRATHYLQPASGAAAIQPYVGLELGGAWKSDRQSSTLGGFLGARVPYTPTTDLRLDLLLAHRNTREDTLFGSNGTTTSNRGIAALRLGLGFRY
ncbi:MAG: hypothetical protein AB9M60_09825 [Leptothrix sp. (in: b-proteobacteria)]